MSKTVLIILIIASFLFLLAIYWTIFTSFKPPQEVLTYPPRFITTKPTLMQYEKLFFHIA